MFSAVHTVTVEGPLTANEIAALIRQHGNVGSVRVVDPHALLNERRADGEAASGATGATATASAVVAELPMRLHAVMELEERLEMQTDLLHELELAKKKATESAASFQKQHQAMYDRFMSLRSQFDDQKAALLKTLWVHCGAFHPELREIPVLETSAKFVETDDQVGEFLIGETLGQGQFATVKSCRRDGRPDAAELAVKIIKKDRFTTFTALKRISVEIEVLRRVTSPFIIGIKDVLQTSKHLYIITEKGGKDLFESFDDQPDGIPEPWALEIITGVVKATLYCHEVGICHRDLKPENILLVFDKQQGKCVDVKLCDFGLAAKIHATNLLSDFCGSPGFFAPEMVVAGKYRGDVADIWSVGCVLLELLLGHRRFIDTWMVAYDLDLLHNKDVFEKEIEQAVHKLPQTLTFSPDLNHLLTILLQMEPAARAQAPAIRGHPWFAGCLENTTSSTPVFVRVPAGSSPSGGESKSRFPFSNSDLKRKGSTVGPPTGAAPVNMSAISDALKGLMVTQKPDRSNAASPASPRSPASPATPSAAAPSAAPARAIESTPHMLRPSMRSDSMNCETDESFADVLRAAASNRKGSLAMSGRPVPPTGLDLGRLSDALRILGGGAAASERCDSTRVEPDETLGDMLRASAVDRKGSLAYAPPGGSGGGGGGLDLARLSDALRQLGGGGGGEATDEGDTRGGRIDTTHMSPTPIRPSFAGDDDDDLLLRGAAPLGGRKGTMVGGIGGPTATAQQLDLLQLSAALQTLADKDGAASGDLYRKGSVFGGMAVGSPLDLNQLSAALHALGGGSERKGSIFAPRGGSSGQPMDAESLAEALRGLGDSLDRDGSSAYGGGSGGGGAGGRGASPLSLPATRGSSDRSPVQSQPSSQHGLSHQSSYRARSPAPVRTPSGTAFGSETDRRPAASQRSRSPAPAMPPLPPIDTTLPPLRSPAHSPVTTAANRSRAPSFTADYPPPPAADTYPPGSGTAPILRRSRPPSPSDTDKRGSQDSLPAVRSRSNSAARSRNNSITLPPIEATAIALQALAALQDDDADADTDADDSTGPTRGVNRHGSSEKISTNRRSASEQLTRQTSSEKVSPRPGGITQALSSSAIDTRRPLNDSPGLDGRDGSSVKSLGSDGPRSGASAPVTFVNGVPVSPQGSRQRLSREISADTDARRTILINASELDARTTILTTAADDDDDDNGEGHQRGSFGDRRLPRRPGDHDDDDDDDDETRKLREMLVSSGI